MHGAEGALQLLQAANALRFHVQSLSQTAFGRYTIVGSACTLYTHATSSISVLSLHCICRAPRCPKHPGLQTSQQRRSRHRSAAPAAALAGSAVPLAQVADAADAADGAAAACSGLGCAQEALDAVARPLAGLGSLVPNGELLTWVSLKAACRPCSPCKPGISLL